MRSLFLKERFDLAPLIAQLQGAEWQHLYRDWNAAHALKDFEAEKSDGGLPTTMIALEGDDLRGSVSVVFDDLPGAQDLNPWVASLYVLPKYRGQGVGGFLLNQVSCLLQRNQVQKAYLFTEKSQSFFRRYGWRTLRSGNANGFEVEIMTNAEQGATPDHR